MIINPKILGTEVQFSLGRRSAHWAMALVAGSVFLACSGTIDTPTDEYPTPTRTAAAADDDADAPAPSANPPRTPAATANDDAADEPPAPAANAADDEPVSEEPPAGEESPAEGATTLAFEADIWPIFSTTCAPCHAGGGAGGNNVGDPDVATAFDEVTRVGDRILDLIDVGRMPPQCAGGAPGDTGCMAEDDFATLQAWFDAGSPE